MEDSKLKRWIKKNVIANPFINPIGAIVTSKEKDEKDMNEDLPKMNTEFFLKLLFLCFLADFIRVIILEIFKI